ASTNIASNLVLNGGTFKYTGAGDGSNRLFFLGTAGGTFESAGDAFGFSNTGSMGFNGQSGARTLTLTRNGTHRSNISVIIGDNGGATGIIKNGSTTWGLCGANTYTGGTTVNAGTLLISTNLGAATSDITVNGGILDVECDCSAGNLSGSGGVIYNAD